MSQDKKVSRAKLASVLKSNTNHSDDLAERTVVTSATADKDHLVTASSLMPDQEDIVLSAQHLEKAYLDELKFNEEKVEITISEDTNSEYPIDPVALSVNGKQIFIKRGVATVIPRKFVECLCNPTVRVKTKQTKNNLGEDATTLERSRSLQFPFQLSDPNPKGKEWLRRLLSRE
jgi:hypothetical protein